MRNYNPQPNQVEINNEILSKFYNKGIWDNDLFEYIDSKNYWLPKFLECFEHQDTYFTDKFVRIQGWLTPDNSFIPACNIECCSDGKLFIMDITLSL